LSLLLRTIDTVPTETLAALATSLMVIDAIRPPVKYFIIIAGQVKCTQQAFYDTLIQV